MIDKNKLILVKSIHSLVWLIMASAAIFILYAGVTNTVNIWLWISIGLLIIESIVLILNRWTCPLTPIAMKYTSEQAHNFDIYLPKVIAKYNKVIFGTIFIIGLVLVILNFLKY